jgi:hypothetical protein
MTAREERSLGEVELGCDLLRELVVGGESCIVPDDDGGRIPAEVRAEMEDPYHRSEFVWKRTRSIALLRY